MKKIKLAFYSASGCSGCMLSFFDLEEFFISSERFSIVWAPMFTNSKLEDLEKIDKIDVTFIEGSIRLSEHEEIVKILREKSEKVVALGTCAVFGGVPGLSNFYSTEEILSEVFGPDKEVPKPRLLLDGKYELTLPEFRDEMRRVEEVIDVDHFVPGCPPSEDQLLKIIDFNFEEKWIVEKSSVCNVCPRKVEEIKVSSVKRAFERDDGRCFLIQGILCFGPLTPGNCEATCVKVNVPCRGCYGAFPNVRDFGAKVVDLLSSIAEKNIAEELSRKYPNLARVIYAYTLPSAIINKRVRKR
ncbi:hypothetical protein [Ferroglobus sp.]|uniref:NADH-quinone oxidoreductase subunit B family protein n=1 Tax=Ferroglobus sp. TaxID=2614230 RepID=UPI0025C30869|nr:hypothetical protein [Ferroglobus sp.]